MILKPCGSALNRDTSSQQSEDREGCETVHMLRAETASVQQKRRRLPKDHQDHVELLLRPRRATHKQRKPLEGLHTSGPDERSDYKRGWLAVLVRGRLLPYALCASSCDDYTQLVAALTSESPGNKSDYQEMPRCLANVVSYIQVLESNRHDTSLFMPRQ